MASKYGYRIKLLVCIISALVVAFCVEAQAASTASLSVTSTPSGASVYLDGKADPEGTTPAQFTNIATGKHTVLFKLDGYKRATKSIKLKKNQARTLNVRLAPIKKAKTTTTTTRVTTSTLARQTSTATTSTVTTSTVKGALPDLAVLAPPTWSTYPYYPTVGKSFAVSYAVKNLGNAQAVGNTICDMRVLDDGNTPVFQVEVPCYLNIQPGASQTVMITAISDEEVPKGYNAYPKLFVRVNGPVFENGVNKYMQEGSYNNNVYPQIWAPQDQQIKFVILAEGKQARLYPELRGTIGNPDPLSPTAADKIKISAHVLNAGRVPAEPGWKLRLDIDDRKGVRTYTYPKTLGSYANDYVTFSPDITLMAGTHTLTLVVDSDGKYPIPQGFTNEFVVNDFYVAP